MLWSYVELKGNSCLSNWSSDLCYSRSSTPSLLYYVMCWIKRAQCTGRIRASADSSPGCDWAVGNFCSKQLHTSWLLRQYIFLSVIRWGYQPYAEVIWFFDHLIFLITHSRSGFHPCIGGEVYWTPVVILQKKNLFGRIPQFCLVGCGPQWDSEMMYASILPPTSILHASGPHRPAPPTCRIWALIADHRPSQACG